MPASLAKNYIFQGKVKWFKHQSPNKFGNYSHDLYFTPESLELFKKLKEPNGERQGIQTVLRQDEDGFYASMTRPSSRTYVGRTRTFNPPIIIDKDNNTIYDILIGNGSDVTTKVQWYPYNYGNKKGSAIRWESSRIDNLIPFITQRDNSQWDNQQLKGYDKVPVQEPDF